MVITEEEKKVLEDLAKRSAFDSFLNEHKIYWKDSTIWKEAQKELLKELLHYWDNYQGEVKDITKDLKSMLKELTKE